MSAPINFFKEKLILQEEEKQLKKMLEKFQDQQNRLKIEELALISMMKMEREKLERGESVNRSAPSSRQPGSESSRTFSSITSKEMNNYAPIGIVMSEDASVINKEFLDLQVNSGFSHKGAASNAKYNEEEEEEEMDSEEEDKQAIAEAASESVQLMSFMEDF